MDYPVVLSPLSKEDGGGFLAFAPDLPGCMSDGETPEEALANFRDAFGEWHQFVESRGNPVPPPGVAAECARKEQAMIIDALKDMREQFDGVEERIDEVERKIDDLREKIEHVSAWQRFSAVIGTNERSPERRDISLC